MATALTIETGRPEAALAAIAPGRCFALELVEQPDAPRAPSRTLGRLDLELRVLDGIVCLAAGDDATVLCPGDSAMVPAGTTFRRWNARDELARWIETYRRA